MVGLQIPKKCAIFTGTGDLFTAVYLAWSEQGVKVCISVPLLGNIIMFMYVCVCVCVCASSCVCTSSCVCMLVCTQYAIGLLIYF